MTWFLVTAAAMAALALAWVLPALLRSRGAIAPAQSRASNLALLKDQLAELESDVAAGILPQSQYQQAREDLERRALEEARDSTTPAVAAPARAPRTAVVMAIAIPLCAVALYWQFGTPGAIAPASVPRSAANVTPQEVEAMVAKLAVRLEQQPDDGNGWALLARSYLVMQRPAEAVAAYERAIAILKDNADLLADYADALAMQQGRRLEGKPLQIVERALQINPMQWKALAMAGAAAFERKDYTQAVAYWEKLQSRAEPGSELAREIAANIEEARQRGGIKTAAGKGAGPAAKSQGVEGNVTLSRELAERAAPSDTVFIYARAPAGPRMPLAVLRMQVKDLPAKFRLDDSLAMAPGMTLSGFPEVVVSARVSKSANAMPQSGDLQAAGRTVKSNQRNVAIVIDSVVP